MGSLGNGQMYYSLRRGIYITGEREGNDRFSSGHDEGKDLWAIQCQESIWRVEAQERILSWNYLYRDTPEPWELMRFSERKI